MAVNRHKGKKDKGDRKGQRGLQFERRFLEELREVQQCVRQAASSVGLGVGRSGSEEEEEGGEGGFWPGEVHP